APPASITGEHRPLTSASPQPSPWRPLYREPSPFVKDGVRLHRPLRDTAVEGGGDRRVVLDVADEHVASDGPAGLGRADGELREAVAAAGEEVVRRDQVGRRRIDG